MVIWTVAAILVARAKPMSVTVRKRDDSIVWHGGCVTRRGKMKKLPKNKEKQQAKIEKAAKKTDIKKLQ